MTVKPGAINGGMTVNDPTTKGSLLVITVDAIDDKVSQIKSADGRVIMAKAPVDNMKFYARFEDPRDNVML